MKNKIKIGKVTVEKSFVSSVAFEKEKYLLSVMSGSGMTPVLLSAKNQTISMSKISGRRLSDCVQTDNPLPLLCRLAVWIKDFTKYFFEKTGRYIVLDDINPRNFIVDEKVYGIDFESWHYGDAKDNYAGLLAMASSLYHGGDADNTDIRGRLADYICDLTGCDREELHKKAQRKTDFLSARRKAMQHIKKTTFVLLAGGNSSRMGTDKGLLAIGSHTFTDEIVYNMSVFDNMMISANSAEYERFNIRVVKDNFSRTGPIGALQAALSAAQADWIFTLPCDMPFVSRDTVIDLFNKADFSKDCIITQADGRLFPTVALYSQKALDCIEGQIAKGDYKLMKIFDSLNTQTVTVPNPREFVNINTPQDYKDIVGR